MNCCVYIYIYVYMPFISTERARLTLPDPSRLHNASAVCASTSAILGSEVQQRHFVESCGFWMFARPTTCPYIQLWCSFIPPQFCNDLFLDPLPTCKESRIVVSKLLSLGSRQDPYSQFIYLLFLSRQIKGTWIKPRSAFKLHPDR